MNNISGSFGEGARNWQHSLGGGRFPQGFLQRVRNHRDFNEILQQQKDNSNKTSSNEELFAEIERSRQNQTNSSAESKELPRSKTVDRPNRVSINTFNTRLLYELPEEQEDNHPLIKEITKVFNSKEFNSRDSQSDQKQLEQKYGSYLSTEISNEPDLQKVSSRFSLLTSGSDQYKQQQYYYDEEQNSFYEDNHRRKRKTISDEDSHMFLVRVDRVNKVPMKVEMDRRTTVMVKNIPNKYTIQLLKDLIDKNHANSYDFLYLPIDFKNKCNMGYAFINFVEPGLIVKFFNEFQGKKWPHFNSEKICQLRYARIQGRSALIQHFQFSSVMNQKDKKLKPVIVPLSELQRIQQLIKVQKQRE